MCVCPFGMFIIVHFMCIQACVLLKVDTRLDCVKYFVLCVSHGAD